MTSQNDLVFDPQLIRRFDINGPRYTSYPTADRFVEAFDTRALQDYLGHRQIQHTVRYTELASDRFNGFWAD